MLCICDYRIGIIVTGFNTNIAVDIGGIKYAQTLVFCQTSLVFCILTSLLPKILSLLWCFVSGLVTEFFLYESDNF